MAEQLNLNTEKIEKIKTKVQGINDIATSQADLIAQISEALEGKAVGGGGSAAYSAIDGTFTYQQHLSAPGTYEYYLYWDNPVEPRQAPILSVYCIYIDTVTSTVFKVLVACLERSHGFYTSNCNVFQQSGGATAYGDYVKLAEAIIITDGRYEFKEFAYMAVIPNV